MHLRSKLTSELCQKVGSSDGKTKQNHLETPTLPPLSQKPLYLLKKDERLYIFYCKIECTYKFYLFTIKNALGNMSESNEFRFENSLNNLDKMRDLFSLLESNYYLQCIFVPIAV